MVPLFFVAFLWGTTNPLIKRGSLGLNKLKKDSKYRSASGMKKIWLDLRYLAQCREYLIPLLINLSGSLLFVFSLSGTSINN